MITERTLRLKVLALLAPAGALAGHCLAYVAAIPDAAQRAEVLEASGHAWMDGVVAPGGLAAALLGVFVLYSRYLRDGPRARRWRRDLCLWLAPRLVVAQLVVFYVLELAERAVLGVPLTELVFYGLVEHGAAAQLLLAVVLTVAVWVVALAAERLCPPTPVWCAPPPTGVLIAMGPGLLGPSTSPVLALGARAPPS